MPEFFKDQRGRVLGSVTEAGGRRTYLDRKGALVARVFGGKTFDDKGAVRGSGDQGLRLFKS